jgi:6-pyruvoyltetrahydropterin/6-carboxytetrahydropterin synthase
VFRLTREVRFAVNHAPDDQLASRPPNSFGGYPALTGAGQYFALQVTLAGELEPRTSYLLNIKQVDEAVRGKVIPFVTELIRASAFGGGAGAAEGAFKMLRDAFRPVEVESARWFLTPFLAYEVRRSELPMVRLSQRFEFSASHRLHNPRFSDEENRRKFGKCNNPHGHGHNYEVQVTLAGEPDQSVGVLIDVPAMERIVSSTVIDRFDHKNLNVETEEFRDLIPSVENIAMVIFRMLKPQFERQRARLASVTVWETPKTWCEYSE